MKDLLKFEWEKQRGKWGVLVVFLLMLSLYLFRGLTGNVELYARYRNVADRELNETIKSARPSGVVDEAFIRKWRQTYREYIDAHRMSDARIKRRMKKWDEVYEIKDILYDMEHANLVLSSEDFNSREFDLMVNEVMPYVEFYEKGADYLIDNYSDRKSFAPSLRKDLEACMREHWGEKELRMGYHTGFDILVGVNNQLPYTLGIVLIFCFYSLFAVERRHRMKALQLTSRHGRTRQVTAKLLYALLGTTLLWLIFQAVMLLGVWMRFGLEGGDCTIFEPLFINAYGYSYLQCYLRELAVSYFGTLSFTLLVLTASSFLPRVAALAGSMVFVLLTCSVIQSYRNVKPAFGTMEKFKVLMPTQLMGAFHTFQDYQAYDFGTFILRLPVMSGIAIAAYIVVFLLLIYRREAGGMGI